MKDNYSKHLYDGLIPENCKGYISIYTYWRAIKASKAFFAGLNLYIFAMGIYGIIQSIPFLSFHSFSLGCASSSCVYLYSRFYPYFSHHLSPG